MPLAVRHAAHTAVVADGCWLWTGKRTTQGYGALTDFDLNRIPSGAPSWRTACPTSSTLERSEKA